MDRGNIIDSSDDDVLNFVAHLDQERRPKVIIRVRPDNFQIWDDYDFFVRYRLKKDTVRRICNEIRDDISNSTNWNSALTSEQMLLITLRFYATGSFLNAVGDLNGIHKSTVSRIVKRVSHAIAVLRPRYITFPTIDEVPEITQGFFNIASFPGVIGAIDCTHVKICSPGGNDAEIYRNRKGYFSLNIQAVCDYNLKFRNIVSRWPGSAHDSHIFNNSYLRAQFEQQTFGENILLGDSGYRNRNYLLTPLLNPRTAAENLYNEAHIRTRNSVERLFDIWKRRFPVLATGMRLNICTSQCVVVATAVLHNIAREENEDEPPIDPGIQQIINEVNAIQANINGENIQQDNRRRYHLIANYFHNLANDNI